MRYQGVIRRLRDKLPKNNQKGFTLIELLVVISILGILAAVVTMSLVGITAVATTRAAETEKNTVQIAYDTMLADLRVDSSNACNGAPSSGGTNDMTTFPTADAWSANPTSVGQPVQLYPHYLREKKTHGIYYCTGSGEITQGAYTP